MTRSLAKSCIKCMSAAIFILLILLAPSVIPVPVRAQELARVQMQQSPTVQPEPDPTLTALAKEKARLEVEKLQIENANNERNLFTLRGWINLLYGNVSVIVAIFLGFWGLYRYLRERREELQKREDERFEGVVKSLGSEQKEERIGAAVLLPTFLRQDYERFYVQVFNLAAGNLRTLPPTNKKDAVRQKSDADLMLQTSIAQALLNVFRESYPLALSVLVKKHKGDSITVITGQYLNATGVQLDGAHLVRADLHGAWLRQASLQNATLINVNFADAVLEDSVMSSANLKDAVLIGVNLKRSDLVGANLENAIISDGRIDDVKFRNATLKKITIERCTAGGTDFLGADLSDAKFIDVDFGSSTNDTGKAKKVNLESARNLEGACFVGAKGLSSQQIQICKEKKAIFRESGANCS